MKSRASLAAVSAVCAGIAVTLGEGQGEPFAVAAGVCVIAFLFLKVADWVLEDVDG